MPGWLGGWENKRHRSSTRRPAMAVRASVLRGYSCVHTRRGRVLARPLYPGPSVRDSPEGPLKQLGKSRLKPAKKPRLNASCLSDARGTAHAALAPAAHHGGPLKGPLEQASPLSRVHASLEQAPPRSRVHTPLDRASPRSRLLHTRTPVPARGYGHLLL
jgi:hypothetical protein